MKLLLAGFLAVAFSVRLIASESALTRTFQPLDGLGAGEIIIAPVMCYDRYARSGLPTAIGLITARNTPPANGNGGTQDVNVASICGLALACEEDGAGRLTITLDCRAFSVPTQAGNFTEGQVVGATLECLRRVGGARLDAMTLKVALKPEGQEGIQILFDAFVRQPKDKPVRWK